MGSGLDILVIDDDRDLVNSMKLVLQSQGYQVRHAFNGQNGYKQIQGKAPNLIILDVMMATDTEGFDLAYKLSRDPKYQRIPILMVSAFTSKMAEQGPETFQHILGEDWPVAMFLDKPIKPDELLRAVEELLAEKARP